MRRSCSCQGLRRHRSSAREREISWFVLLRHLQTPKPGSSPRGAAGFISSAPRGRAERVCRGCVCLSPAWGGERVIWGRSGSQGRAPLGTALISELFSNQGRAAIPAEERRRLCTQVLCGAVATATGFSLDSGGQSRPLRRAVRGDPHLRCPGFSTCTPPHTGCRLPLHCAFPQRWWQHRRCPCQRCTSSRQQRLG